MAWFVSQLKKFYVYKSYIDRVPVKSQRQQTYGTAIKQQSGQQVAQQTIIVNQLEI